MPLEQEPGWIAYNADRRAKAKRQRETVIHRRITSAAIVVLAVLGAIFLIGAIRVIW